jgi:hypothetical protein
MRLFDFVTEQVQRDVSSRSGTPILCAIENLLVLSADSIAEIDCYLNEASLKSLRDAFLRIKRLQRDHSVYVSFSELMHSPTVLKEVSQFIDDVARCHVRNDPKLLNKNLTTTAKKVCSLLTGGSKADESDFWIAASASIAIELIKGHQDDQILELLSDVGFLPNVDHGLPGRAQILVALALCSEIANWHTTGMQKIVKAASLVKDWSVLTLKG